jgi:hypothetical protein
MIMVGSAAGPNPTQYLPLNLESLINVAQEPRRLQGLIKARWQATWRFRFPPNRYT